MSLMDDDDDEFGDLYTDVLRPSSTTPTPPSSLFPSQSNPHSNFVSQSDDDEQLLYGPPDTLTPKTLISNPNNTKDEDEEPRPIFDSGAVERDGGEEDGARVSTLDASDLPQPGETRVSGGPESKIRVSTEKMEIGDEINDLDVEPVIPGLSTGPFVFFGSVDGGDGKNSGKDGGGGGGEDWGSDDSEDDLQIVLNDNGRPIGMERNDGVGSDDDEDEDGEDLVIVADGDQLHNQAVEEQEWGEESNQLGLDGERKELGEGVKGNLVVGRVGYSNHGYHPHHSQFKYVRPGATPVPGGTAIVPLSAPGQVRPPVAMGSMTGRGRGDWRPVGIKSVPAMQKGFHSGFGPVWANNPSARAFGNGLDFTLPSHKTVFDIDIDTFEEKPWRYPGVDTSDFFNFGLDEENWKDYSKQLEQLRLEATMQSKIRVYESGRSEQDYDPDLPPELAAAAGHHDISTENAHVGKMDGGQADSMGQGRGAARMRPPLPTGRAIQVEGGYGERLPSIDTRPPRIRDPDAIIEIVLQDSVDDDSITSNGPIERPENDTQGEELKGDLIEDNRQDDAEYFDRIPQTYNGRTREMVARRAPFVGPIHNAIHEGDGILPFPSEAPLQYHPSSKVRTPIYPGGPYGPPHGGRWPQGAARERYPQINGDLPNDSIRSHSSRVNKFDDHEKSDDSIEHKQTSEVSSPVTVEAAGDLSIEQKGEVHDDELALADGTEAEGEEIASDSKIPSDTLGDSDSPLAVKKQKLSSRIEQPGVEDIANGEDLRTTCSDNSKAKSGSSRDNQKRREGGDEVLQDGRSRHMGESKRLRDEDEHSFRRRDDYGRDGRQEVDRNRMVAKGREDLYHSYPYRDRDSNSAHYVRGKPEGLEKPKERDSSIGIRQRRDDDTHGRSLKDEDMRRRERVEEIGSRHRSKIHESERHEKDELLHSRKRVDDGDWRSRHDKDGGPRQRERDDALIGRHKNLDDPHIKRRKDEEHHRRQQVEKEEVLHGYRAREDTGQRKRERDDGLDLRREDQARVRDKPDDHLSVRHRAESWRPREREREDRHRLKHPHEDTQSNREREGRGVVRSGRVLDDKSWVGHARAKDESKGIGSDKDYQLKDKRRHSEQPKKRDRVEEETLSRHRGREDMYARENQFNSEERNSKHERLSSLNDRNISASDNQWMYKDKHKGGARKSKESEGSDQVTVDPGKRKQEDHDGHRNEKVSTKGTNEQESSHLSMVGPTDPRDHGQSRSSSALSKKSHHHHHHERHSSRKHGEDAAASDEEQQNSRRGRSKLERWASHKEKDNNMNAPSSPSSSSKAKEIERLDDSSKIGGEDDNADMVHASERIGEDRHMDTVAKLKKRSERFKLPMPSDVDGTTNKKVESEIETNNAEAEIKQERPARKRRWVGS